MLDVIKRLFVEEEGQGMVEYGLIIALIAVVILGAFVFLRDGITGVFEKIKGTLTSPEIPAGE